jgi:RNA polymerase sigma-70 factor (ECF subfamily)
MSTTSLTLLERIRQPGQTEAWTRFIQLYVPLLLKWARRAGFHRADAEDLTQMILMKLLRLLPHYVPQPSSSFRAWLSTIARNEAIDFRTRRGTRPLPGDGGLVMVATPQEPDVHEHEYRADLVRTALRLIRGDFEPTTWTAFTAVVVEGRAVAEVAEELGLTPNAIYLARNRVLTRLRAELQDLLE